MSHPDLIDHVYGLADARPHVAECAACGEDVDRLRRERALFEAALRAAPEVRRPSRWPYAAYAALLLLGLFALLFPRAEVRLPAAQDDAEALTRQLGAEDVEVRARAVDALRKLGPKAEPALKKALDSEEPEVRARAWELIEKLRERKARGRLWDKRGAENDGAVKAALDWLARHQAPDGSWTVKSKDPCVAGKGGEDYDTGLTSLALLAFLAAGHTQASETHGDVVRKGLTLLMARQDREGHVGRRDALKHMYGHALGALALADAYGMSNSDFLKEPAARAAAFTVRAQNPGAAWRYTPKSGDNDTSVTFWATLSLRVAWHAGLEVPDAAFAGAKAWLDEVTDPDFFRAGYTHRGTGKVFIPGLNESFDHHEALTGAAVFLRRWLGDPADARLCRSGAELLLRDVPRRDKNAIDYYYWHLGSLALFAQGGAGWAAWEAPLKKILLENQVKEGCAAGTWPATDRWSGEGGAVYATALNVLTLRTSFRFAR